MQSLRRALLQRGLPSCTVGNTSSVSNGGIEGCRSIPSLQQWWAAYAKKAKAEKAEGADNKTQRLLKVMELQQTEEQHLTPEELAEAERRVKEYSRLKMRQHREYQADLTTKLKLKKAAIAALPPRLRAAALENDYEPFPANRQVWYSTPPIENYGQEQQAATAGSGERQIGNKRRR